MILHTKICMSCHWPIYIVRWYKVNMITKMRQLVLVRAFPWWAGIVLWVSTSIYVLCVCPHESVCPLVLLLLVSTSLPLPPCLALLSVCWVCYNLLKPAAIHCTLGILSAVCQVRANPPFTHKYTFRGNEGYRYGPVTLFTYNRSNFARLPNGAVDVFLFVLECCPGFVRMLWYSCIFHFCGCARGSLPWYTQPQE